MLIVNTCLIKKFSNIREENLVKVKQTRRDNNPKDEENKNK